MWAIRCLCAGYWLLLTAMLLVPDPLAILGLAGIPGDSSDVYAHFAAFALLGLLVPASAWPLRPALLAGGLIGYGLATELLQSAVGRDTAWLDLLANLLGLAAGTAAWWVLRKWRCRRTDTRNQE